MRLFRWLEPGAIYLVICMALGAGLAASYGRELEAHRHPDRAWWLRRLLIMPLLAIAATAATEAFELSNSVSAFTAGMLSLGGYDAIRFMERRWKDRAEAMVRVADASPRDEGGADAVLPRE